MRHCEFCATELPDHTTFCWHCGRAPTSSTEALTGVSSSSAGNLPVEKVSTAPNLPVASLPVQTDSIKEMQEQDIVTAIGIAESSTLPHAQLPSENHAPTNTGEEEEEEKRRRAAMLGPGLSLLGEVVTHPPGADVPAVQGVPQFKGVPTVQGAPHISQAPHMPSIPKWQISRLPTYPSIPAVHHAAPAQPAAATQPAVLQGTTSPLPQPEHPLPGKHGPGGRQSGCVPALVIAGVACLLVVASVIGLGFTILSPSLSLGGSTNVTWGESIHLHGSNFIPGSTVRLTLDGAAPLYYTSRDRATQVSYSNITTAGLETIAEQFVQDSSAKNSVVVSRNGTFNVSVVVSPSWHAGHHVIRASEEISPRSAQLAFTIEQPGTPSTTTPTETPTPLTQGLSCVKPASIALTASTGYTQPVSQEATLCAIGSGTVNWTANWDYNAAPWLQLDHTSGKINAPGQGQVTVSTLAASLKPGKYTTAITFSSQASSPQVSLTVSFTVEAGCVSVAPGTFKVSSAIGATQTQTATVTNCGNAPGSWYAATSASWLKVVPASGTLSAGAAQQVTLSMSQGKMGTYTAQGTFTLGESQSTVHVIVKVQAPMLSVNPTSLNARTNCQRGQMSWLCNVKVTNDGNVHANLNWSTVSNASNVNFSPASGTLAAGASIQVVVDISFDVCSAVFTFTGPANSVPVLWTGICN